MSTARVCAAFVAAQAELRAIRKDSTNPHFKNKYASLDTIIEDVRPVLAKHELALMQGAEPANEGKALAVSTFLVHVSGETLHSTCYIPMVKLDAQGAGGALTYGRRYGIAALLCLATEEDDDGNTASRPPAAKRSSPAPKPTPAPPSNGATKHDTTAKRDEDKTMGGKRLGDYTSKELQDVVTKRRGDPNYATLVEACGRILTSRALGDDDDSKVTRMKASVEKEGATLPF